MTAPNSLREALDADLHRMGISKKAFADALRISYEAVRRWEVADSVPTERLSEMRGILGPEAQAIAYAQRHQDFSNETRPGELFEVGNPKSRLRRSTDFEEPPSVHEELAAYRKAARPSMSEAEAALVAALPEGLRQHVGGVVFAGQIVRRVDYLSPRWIIEVKRFSHANLSEVATAGLHQLTLVREMVRVAYPRSRPVLILVPEGGEDFMARSDEFAAMHRVTEDASVIGARAVTVGTIEAAAALIAGLERADPPTPMT